MSKKGSTWYGVELLEIKRRRFRLRCLFHKNTTVARIISVDRFSFTTDSDSKTTHLKIEATLDKASIKAVAGRKRKRKKRA